MKLDIFLNEKENLLAENKILKLMIIIIGLSVWFNTYVVFKTARHQRTIIIPARLNSTVELTENKASEDYLRAMARHITYLTFNYSPATARRQFEELLRLYRPNIYPEAKEKLFNLAETIETIEVSSSFIIDDIKLHNKEIEVVGDVTQFTRNKKVVENKRIVYRIPYEIDEGRFWISKFVQEVISQ